MVNTAAAYDPKTAEFYEFWDFLYPNATPGSKYTVDADKAFKFLFYHGMRNKYAVGGKGVATRHGFDGDDYNRVWQQYSDPVDTLRQYPQGCPTDVTKKLFKDLENPLGVDQLNTYKATIRGIHGSQVEQNANSLAWEFILTRQIKTLFKMVQERKARINRETYQERVESDFAPFTSIDQVNPIEQKFWDDGKKSLRAAFCTMRNRMTFLKCYSGILRHETVFLTDLSDMVGLQHQRERDPHPIFIQVMQMAQGKFLLFVVDCCV